MFLMILRYFQKICEASPFNRIYVIKFRHMLFLPRMPEIENKFTESLKEVNINYIINSPPSHVFLFFTTLQHGLYLSRFTASLGIAVSCDKLPSTPIRKTLLISAREMLSTKKDNKFSHVFSVGIFLPSTLENAYLTKAEHWIIYQQWMSMKTLN